MKRRADLVLAVVLVSWVGLVFAPRGIAGDGADGEIQRGRKELERLAREIEGTAKKIASLEKEERAAAEGLRAIAAGIAESDRLVTAYERQTERLSEDVARRAVLVDGAREKSEAAAGRLAAHVDRIYRRGKPAYIAILLGAEDFGGALRRARYVAGVLAAERTLVAEVRERRRVLETELAGLEARRDELGALSADHAAEKARLESLRGEKRGLLARARRERSLAEAAIQEMQESAQSLSALLERLEKERKRAEARGTREPPVPGDRATGRAAPGGAYAPASRFAASEGSLPWPIRGEIISRFGRVRHPRYGTQTFNPGIDVKAAEGEPIGAVADGRVEFVDWVRGYGKTVILSHGDGYYTLYAHASRVLVVPGQIVTRGEVIARAGDTDSLNGSCLHFELRRGGRAVDPVPWLAGTR